jgi:hypothetical protein
MYPRERSTRHALRFFAALVADRGRDPAFEAMTTGCHRLFTMARVPFSTHANVLRRPKVFVEGLRKRSDSCYRQMVMRRLSRPLRRPCSRTGGRLLATIALMLGLLSLQLGQLSHALFVKHGVCEHGDLVHVVTAVDAGAHGGKPTPVVARRSTETQLRSATGQNEGHDHCDSNAVRARVAESAPLIVVDRLLDDVCLAPDIARPEQRPIAVLWLAPKSSPPCA